MCRTLASITQDMDLILHLGTKIPQAAQCGQNVEKNIVPTGHMWLLPVKMRCKNRSAHWNLRT